VGNKRALDLRANVDCEKNKKAVACRYETSLAKVIFFFTALGNKSDDAVLAAAGTYAFHTVKLTARLYYSKQYFLILR
jgi:hypothetical protein